MIVRFVRDEGNKAHGIWERVTVIRLMDPLSSLSKTAIS